MGGHQGFGTDFQTGFATVEAIQLQRSRDDLADGARNDDEFGLVRISCVERSERIFITNDVQVALLLVGHIALGTAESFRDQADGVQMRVAIFDLDRHLRLLVFAGMTVATPQYPEVF